MKQSIAFLLILGLLFISFTTLPPLQVYADNPALVSTCSVVSTDGNNNTCTLTGLSVGNSLVIIMFSAGTYECGCTQSVSDSMGNTFTNAVGVGDGCSTGSCGATAVTYSNTIKYVKSITQSGTDQITALSENGGGGEFSTTQIIAYAFSNGINGIANSCNSAITTTNTGYLFQCQSSITPPSQSFVVSNYDWWCASTCNTPGGLGVTLTSSISNSQYLETDYSGGAVQSAGNISAISYYNWNFGSSNFQANANTQRTWNWLFTTVAFTQSNVYSNVYAWNVPSGAAMARVMEFMLSTVLIAGLFLLIPIKAKNPDSYILFLLIGLTFGTVFGTLAKSSPYSLVFVFGGFLAIYIWRGRSSGKVQVPQT